MSLYIKKISLLLKNKTFYISFLHGWAYVCIACVGVCKCHSPCMEFRVNLWNSVFSFHHMSSRYPTWVIRLVLYISASVFFLKDSNYLCLVSSFLISLDKCLFIQLVLSKHSFWVKHLSLEVSRASAILFP